MTNYYKPFKPNIMKKLPFETVQIFQSNDYSRFSFFDFNRKVDKSHVNKLKESIAIRGFLGCIIVVKINIDGEEAFKILEGQHRFTAAMELGIPFKFEIHEIESKRELALFIATVNNSAKAWGTNQFLNVWSKMEIKEYVKLLKIQTETKIQITPLVSAYSGKSDMKAFRGGVIEFYDEVASDTMIEQIMDLKDVLPTKAFCRRAIIKVMRDKAYNHSNIKPYIERRFRQGGFSENENELLEELKMLMRVSNKK